MIKITVKEENHSRHKTPCLIVPCLDQETPGPYLNSLDQALNKVISQSYKDRRFQGKLNQTLLLNAKGLFTADHVLLVGVGKADEFNLEKLRQASASSVKLAQKSCFTKAGFDFANKALSKALGKKVSAQDGTQAIAEGAALGLYRFDEYKSKSKDEPPPSQIKEIVVLVDSKQDLAQGRKGVSRGLTIASAVMEARSLQSHPSNKATPSYLAQTARALGRKHGFTCKVLGPGEMNKLGMGSLMGVAQGSEEPARFIIMEYSGAKKKGSPVVLVGKGVTFDTGGISLKPSASMDEMKMDMSGAAAVIGAMAAVAGVKLPVNVIGLVPATENMPSGKAIKPGDILTSMSKKTIEVLNTDAEGRLILCDALSYAERYKPRAVIDLATLTGAVLHALGHQAAAIMGNDDALIADLIASGEETGERLWQLPLWPEHEKAIKSDVADLKNIAGPGVGAGTITGAAFLKQFVGDMPWVHIDIAGTAWGGEDRHYVSKGPSGYGVRLLLRYLEQLS